MPGEWEHAACGINHPTNAGGDDEQEQRASARSAVAQRFGSTRLKLKYDSPDSLDSTRLTTQTAQFFLSKRPT